jgi:hypothetical protein
MNRNFALSLVLAAAAAGPAFADDITIEATPFVSTLSRAQVQSELQQFRQSGVNPWADEYNPVASFRSDRTRAEVTGEFLAERDAVSAMGGEDSGSVYMARREPHARDTQVAATPAPTSAADE